MRPHLHVTWVPPFTFVFLALVRGMLQPTHRPWDRSHAWIGAIAFLIIETVYQMDFPLST